MGKHGKAARKRRRDAAIEKIKNNTTKKSKIINNNINNNINNDDGTTSSTTDSNMIGRHNNNTEMNNNNDDDNKINSNDDDTIIISDEALETTISTLYHFIGNKDTLTGKSILKKKRYRTLRRVLFELQQSENMNIGAGGVMTTTSIRTGPMNRPCSSNNSGVVVTQEQQPPIISLSKLTALITAQIENNAWDAAIQSFTTLSLYQKQEKKQSATSLPNKTNNKSCFKPKLGALQRWVRMIDAAGTDDPNALKVLDAMLRVVSTSDEESAVVSKEDKERAIFKEGTMGHVRLFPPLFELCGVRCRRDGDDGDDNHHDDDNNTVRDPQHDNTSLPPTSQNNALKTTTTTPTELSDIIDQFISQHVTTNDNGIHTIHDDTILTDARRQLFRICAFEKGCDRKPPNKYDLSIVTTTTTDDAKHNNTVLSSSFHHDNNIKKIPLPYVKNSFLLSNVLTSQECQRLLTMAVIAGYHPDEPLLSEDQSSIPAHACVWLVDETFERLLFERVSSFLPTYDDDCYSNSSSSSDVSRKIKRRRRRPLGLNRRFRFYRYVPGRYYRPHIDGAWPPSGLDDEGSGGYVYDVTNRWNKNGLQFVTTTNDDDDSDDDDDSETTNATTNNRQTNPPPTTTPRRQLSKLTFLIYLNDNFEGGCTTFLQPSENEVGRLDAFPVTPVTGAVLVFPHGSTDSPLHEGSPVVRGCKYVVRTEVEYYC